MTGATIIATERGEYTISTDATRLDLAVILGFFARSYWAAERPRDVVERSIANSLVFAVFDPTGTQVGFARVVTDSATFGWLADVFVLEEHRGLGLAKALVAAVIDDPRLVGVRFMLGTADAHGLYAQFGFEPLTMPERIMRRPVPPSAPIPDLSGLPGDT